MKNHTIYYNVGNPRPELVVKDLVRMAEEHKPLMIFLCEVADRHAELREVAKLSGYKLEIGRGGPGAERLAVLLSNQIEVLSVRTFQISKRTFVGFNTAGAKSKGGYAAAKYIMRVRFRYAGKVRVRAGTHLVPSAMRRGNKRTRALHNRQVAAIARFMAARVRKLFEVTCGGDYNADPSRDNEKDLLRPLTSEYHYATDETHKRRKIDIAFSSMRIEARALNGYHSDHKPLLVTHPE